VEVTETGLEEPRRLLRRRDAAADQEVGKDRRAPELPRQQRAPGAVDGNLSPPLLDPSPPEHAGQSTPSSPEVNRRGTTETRGFVLVLVLVVVFVFVFGRSSETAAPG
jgi:hypothetical protein